MAPAPAVDGVGRVATVNNLGLITPWVDKLPQPSSTSLSFVPSVAAQDILNLSQTELSMPMDQSMVPTSSKLSKGSPGLSRLSSRLPAPSTGPSASTTPTATSSRYPV